TTYATLRSDDRGTRVSRVKQIVEWLGKDFDGAIIFDEAHEMQNAGGGKGERGDVAASQQGRAGLRLQHALPNARVTYVSATGATTVHNL
ncbi:strawberry notch-like NTP hydrolase domain-containing protein, partial [Staphylococcus aureus]